MAKQRAAAPFPPLPLPHPSSSSKPNQTNTANQGIGKEVARQLAAQGLTVVATSRDPDRGRAAVDELSADPAVRAANGRVELFSPFDVADASTVEALAVKLEKKERRGPVAILVNNAGLAYKGDAWGADEARRTLDVNFRGTRAVVRALLPLMRRSCGGGGGGGGAEKEQLLPLPRVVNVTSSAGGLGMFDRAAAAPDSAAELKRRFLAAGEAGGDEARADALLDGLAAEFEACVADGTWREKGWPGSMYGVSKALENAMGRQLAKRGSGADPLFASINVHPGYIATSMSSFKGPLPPSRGADTVVWAALLPPQEAEAASGAFYHDRRPREY